MTADRSATRSEDLYRRALRVLPGGVSRNTVLREPHPIYAAHASGSRITDIDGIERIDFANNMTALVHGHGHPEIVAAVAEQLKHGTAHTFANEVEVRFAEHLCARVDSFERIRFVNSGTEAVMCALKVARAFNVVRRSRKPKAPITGPTTTPRSARLRRRTTGVIWTSRRASQSLTAPRRRSSTMLS